MLDLNLAPLFPPGGPSILVLRTQQRLSGRVLRGNLGVANPLVLQRLAYLAVEPRLRDVASLGFARQRRHISVTCETVLRQQLPQITHLFLQMRGLPTANRSVGQAVEQADSPFERSLRFGVRINAAGRRGCAVEIRIACAGCPAPS